MDKQFTKNIIFSTSKLKILNHREKIGVFLVVQLNYHGVYPPPLLSGPTTKKTTFHMSLPVVNRRIEDATDPEADLLCLPPCLKTQVEVKFIKEVVSKKDRR